MAKLKEWIAILEHVSPAKEALSFDNPGLTYGDEETEITGVMVALDATETTVAEAAASGCNLLVTHHPMIFSPIRSLTPAVSCYKAVVSAVVGGVAVFAMHTNYDCMADGLCDRFAQAFEMKDTAVLIPAGSGGEGRVGNVSPIALEALAAKTEQTFGVRVRVAGDRVRTISRLAVANGAGANEDLLYAAYKAGAQALVSAEIKHHIALYAKSLGLALIESGHYATEHFSMADLTCRIASEAAEAGIKQAVILSRQEQDPFNK